MAEHNIANYLRTDKPVKGNGKYPIHLRVRVKDKEAKLMTNLEIEKERWDFKKNEPKDKALLIQLNKKKEETRLRASYKPSVGRQAGFDHRIG